MATKIQVRVYQTNTNTFFKVVESSVFTAGTWSYSDGEHNLTIGIDTSGALRLSSGSESAVFVFGTQGGSGKPWCDVVTDLAPGVSGSEINRQYYYPGEGVDRTPVKEHHQLSKSVSNKKNRRFDVEYSVSTGVRLEANIIIH